jgi:hypothetical protein
MIEPVVPSLSGSIDLQILINEHPAQNYINMLHNLRTRSESALQDDSLPLRTIQEDIAGTFVEILRGCVEDGMAKMDKAPCSFAVFVGGSIGRGEASLYSDVEFGIIVEAKSSMDWFLKLSQHIASLLEDTGIECDENFSPPHLVHLQSEERYKKDWRGIYFYPEASEDKDKVFEKKGNAVLIDTAENFAAWQSLKGKVAGSAVLAAILREGK